MICSCLIELFLGCLWTFLCSPQSAKSLFEKLWLLPLLEWGCDCVHFVSGRQERRFWVLELNSPPASVFMALNWLKCWKKHGLGRLKLIARRCRYGETIGRALYEHRKNVYIHGFLLYINKFGYQGKTQDCAWPYFTCSRRAIEVLRFYRRRITRPQANALFKRDSTPQISSNGVHFDPLV